MPLLNHFALDVDFHSWESFYSTWANSIRDALHRVLADIVTARHFNLHNDTVYRVHLDLAGNGD